MKKIVLVLLIFTVVGGAAFAFDLESFPDPIEEGNLLISPVLNLGGFGGWMMLGITGAVDYALPIPFMVGGEVGVAFTTLSGGPVMIPILARFSWHPNFEVDNLDTYLRIKLGYTIGIGGRWYYGWGGFGGFSFGSTLGVRYFFNDTMGVFGELGWDVWGWVYTYFHVGVTFKLDM